MVLCLPCVGGSCRCLGCLCLPVCLALVVRSCLVTLIALLLLDAIFLISFFQSERETLFFGSWCALWYVCRWWCGSALPPCLRGSALVLGVGVGGTVLPCSTEWSLPWLVGTQPCLGTARPLLICLLSDLAVLPWLVCVSVVLGVPAFPCFFGILKRK